MIGSLKLGSINYAILMGEVVAKKITVAGILSTPQYHSARVAAEVRDGRMKSG